MGILHLLKRRYAYFIINTGSFKSTIEMRHLVSFYLTYSIHSSSLNIHGISGHSIPFVGIAITPIFDSCNGVLECDFVFTDSAFNLGLTTTKVLHIKLSFLANSNGECCLKKICNCSQATGGITVPPLFMKRPVTRCFSNAL